MDKIELKKNKLDLEYHGESQKANVFLTLLTIGLLTFFGNLIFLKNNPLFNLGLSITFIITIFSLILYNKKSKRMREILIEIENLK